MQGTLKTTWVKVLEFPPYQHYGPTYSKWTAAIQEGSSSPPSQGQLGMGYKCWPASDAHVPRINILKKYNDLIKRKNHADEHNLGNLGLCQLDIYSL